MNATFELDRNAFVHHCLCYPIYSLKLKPNYTSQLEYLLKIQSLPLLVDQIPNFSDIVYQKSVNFNQYHHHFIMT